MKIPDSITIQTVADLVIANQVIRSPTYKADQAGRRWGDDLIPALMGLFSVKRNSNGEHSNSWIGFAHHWQGEIFRLDFHLYSGLKDPKLILVVTAVRGDKKEKITNDEDIIDIDIPDEIPTEQEWKERQKRYKSIRNTDEVDGSVAVDAYIAALPDWKKDVATQFDHIVQNEVPEVKREIKWHTPFYGMQDQGWFAQFGVFSKYVKLTFLRGSLLNPEPPLVVKNTEGRSLNIKQSDKLDENQLTSWIRQASAIPGWIS